MNKNDIIKKINKEFKQFEIFNNVCTDLEDVKKHIEDNINNLFNDMYVISFGNSYYEGEICSIGYKKVYEFAIIDVDTDEEIVHGNLVCSLCGKTKSSSDSCVISSYLISVNML